MVPVVLLVEDLMFVSRIREAARAHDLDIQTVRTPDQAVTAARGGARLVILDLDSRRLPAAAALAALRADPVLAGLPVVGFFSHVQAQRGREAAESGCTTVLPRSAFVARLDSILAAAAGSGGVGEPGTGA
jgi:CheY-like chemotaxis protein